MATCARCGCKFNKEDARYLFTMHFDDDLDYDTEIDECLCGSCAIDYIEEQIEPEYRFEEVDDEDWDED